MKSISNRTFECIYDNVKRCNYLAKLGFDERIFSRVCFIFNPPTPPLNLKSKNIGYLYFPNLSVHLHRQCGKGILKFLKKFLIAGFFENTIGD